MNNALVASGLQIHIMTADGKHVLCGADTNRRLPKPYSKPRPVAAAATCKRCMAK